VPPTTIAASAIATVKGTIFFMRPPVSIEFGSVPSLSDRTTRPSCPPFVAVAGAQWGRRADAACAFPYP
jgi:hypothetical protein